MADEFNPSLPTSTQDGDDGIQIHCTWSGSTAVLAVHGVLDALTAPRLTQAVRAASLPPPQGLMIDLSGVEFLGSVGMSGLVSAQQELPDATRFAVVADGPVTARPLKLVGVDSILALHSSLQDALADIAART